MANVTSPPAPAAPLGAPGVRAELRQHLLAQRERQLADELAAATAAVGAWTGRRVELDLDRAPVAVAEDLELHLVALVLAR